MKGLCKGMENVVKDFTTSDFWKFIGLEIDHYEAGSVRLKLPIKPSFHNIQHIVHGGIFASILDTSMGMTLRSTGYDVVTTLDMDIHFLNPAKEGTIYCTGEVIHHSRSTALVKAELVNEDDEILAYSTGTFRAVKK